MPRGVRVDQNGVETIKRMTIEGYTQVDIAAAVGINRQTICHYQKKLGLRASNRWHFGETAHDAPLPNADIIPIGSDDKRASDEGQWLEGVCKLLKMRGIRTGFEYTYTVGSDSITMRPGYTNDLEIDIRDLVALGNELLDLAEQVETFK